MNKVISLRLSEGELAEYDRCARNAGMTRAAYIRQALRRALGSSEAKEKKTGESPRAFKSWHLVGSLAVGRLNETRGETKGVARQIVLEKAHAKNSRTR